MDLHKMILLLPVIFALGACSENKKKSRSADTFEAELVNKNVPMKHDVAVYAKFGEPFTFDGLQLTFESIKQEKDHLEVRVKVKNVSDHEIYTVIMWYGSYITNEHHKDYEVTPFKGRASEELKPNDVVFETMYIDAPKGDWKKLQIVSNPSIQTQSPDEEGVVLEVSDKNFSITIEAEDEVK